MKTKATTLRSVGKKQMERIREYCIECIKRESDHWSARRRAFVEILEMIDCEECAHNEKHGTHDNECTTHECKKEEREYEEEIRECEETIQHEYDY